MELLINLIGCTIILIIACLILEFHFAWLYGGEFHISKSGGYRKNWIERLLDGFEILAKM